MEKSDALRVAASGATVADKVRALDAAGYPRAEIAKLLGKRYQHVRNVLEGDRTRRVAPRQSTGVSENVARFDEARSAAEVEDRGGGLYRLTVRADGSVMLPPAVREAFGVEGGGLLMASMEGDEFKLIGAQKALARVREMVRPYLSQGVNIVDELLAERRREVAREERDD